MWWTPFYTTLPHATTPYPALVNNFFMNVMIKATILMTHMYINPCRKWQGNEPAVAEERISYADASMKIILAKSESGGGGGGCGI